MGVSLRTKLVLAAAVPLAALTGLALTAGHSIARREALGLAKERLQTVADLYAARFDGLFRVAGQVAENAAATVAAQPHIDAAELEDLLRDHVTRQPLAFGACFAFEPGAYRPEIPRYAPYVYRPLSDPSTVTVKDLALSFDYTDGTHEWYEAPRTAAAPHWSEPYFDTGGGEIMMTTYSAPIIRDEKFIGVATVDLALADLPTRVDRADLQGGTFAVLSRSGHFVAAPVPELLMKHIGEAIGAGPHRGELAALIEGLGSSVRGVLRVRDFPVEGWHFFCYSNIPATGWTFVAVLDESRVLGPVYAELAARASFFASFSLITLLIVWLVTRQLTKPIERLARAVRELGAGRLDTASIDVRADDELGRLARAFNGMVKDLRRHVSALTEETAARERIEADLRVAREIQASLLPRALPEAGFGALRVYGINLPAKHVAGDFFDVFEVSPGRLMFVIADVSGKGISAAMFMAVARTVLRQTSSADPDASPARIAQVMNRVLVAENERGMFLTMILGVIDTGTGEIVYANAGHPPPLRTNGQACAELFGEVTGTVLAVMEDAVFEERRARLGAGERLVFFTDGVTEAAPPAEVMGRAEPLPADFLGDEGTARLITEVQHLSARLACETITQRVGAFQSGVLRDDVTVLIIDHVASMG